MYSPVLFTVHPDLDQSAGGTRQLPLPPPGLSVLKKNYNEPKGEVKSDGKGI
jgi:hypothetical protein